MRRAERLLAALVEHPDGLSRSAAQELMGTVLEPAHAELSARGHVLHRLPSAWRLDCARRHFDPSAYETLSRASLGQPLEVWEAAASTNDLAWRAVESGAPEGAAWLAESQPAGRGRQGRSWTCPPHAGLLVSLLLRPAWQPVPRLSLLPLVIGLGVCEALRATTRRDVRCKWPNDLWLEEAKVGGILVEARQGATPAVVLGIGLNVTPEAARQAPGAAAALEKEGEAPLCRELLLAQLCTGIERRLDEWRAGRCESLLQAWSDLDALAGRRVRLQTASELLEGCALGITAEGLLRVDTGAGAPRELAAAEVHLL